MVNVGDFARCPQCTRMGRVVWVSLNRKTVGIQCPTSHQPDSYSDSYGFIRARSKANKNSVFLVDYESL